MIDPKLIDWATDVSELQVSAVNADYQLLDYDPLRVYYELWSDDGKPFSLGTTQPLAQTAPGLPAAIGLRLTRKLTDSAGLVTRPLWLHTQAGLALAIQLVIARFVPDRVALLMEGAKEHKRPTPAQAAQRASQLAAGIMRQRRYL